MSQQMTEFEPDDVSRMQAGNNTNSSGRRQQKQKQSQGCVQRPSRFKNNSCNESGSGGQTSLTKFKLPMKREGGRPQRNWSTTHTWNSTNDRVMTKKWHTHRSCTIYLQTKFAIQRVFASGSDKKPQTAVCSANTSTPAIEHLQDKCRTTCNCACRP